MTDRFYVRVWTGCWPMADIGQKRSHGRIAAKRSFGSYDRQNYKKLKGDRYAASISRATLSIASNSAAFAGLASETMPFSSK